MSKYKAFDGSVCEKLRNLNKELTKAQAKRVKAFEDRDGLMAEIASTNVAEVKKIAELKAEAFDAERAIEKLNKSIKWYQSTLMEVIAKADEPGLFEDDVDAKVPREVFAQGPKPKAEKPIEAKPKDPRPVGRPMLALPPAVETGEDQHLDASVKELVAVSPSVLAKLTEAKIVKVGQLAALADADKDLTDAAGLTEKQAENLLKSLASFRRDHRRAGLEVNRGARS
jgi:hypothetical protein